MLRNHFTIFIRTLKKQKIYSLINIVGLAIGVAVCLTIFLFIQSELGYDSYNEKADRTYRIFVKSVINGTSIVNSKTAGPTGPALKRDFPEVETYARLGYYGALVFSNGPTRFREYHVYYTDSTYFDVFTMTFLEGNPKTALTRPNTIVLTETYAKKYFGNERALGRTLMVDDKTPYTVTGVMKDYPENSHFRCVALCSIVSNPIINKNIWLELWYSTYIVLKPGSDATAFEAKLEKAGAQYVAPQAEAVLGIHIQDFLKSGNSYGYFMQPLKSIYLQSARTYGIDRNTAWGDERSGDIAYVYIFGGVAAFILVIAIINFMNLATARSERRAKEVGIRKTLGSDRAGLIRQFMTESIFTSGLSVLLSLALLELFLPAFNNLAGRHLALNYIEHPLVIPALVVFAIILGALAGVYPAFVLSRFSPTRALSAHDGAHTRKSRLRNILVVVQFAISITLMICTIVIKQQLDYIQNKNLGFNKEHLLMIGSAYVLGNHLDAFKEEAMKNPQIVSISTSYRLFNSGVPGHAYFFNKKTGTNPLSMSYLEADENFIHTYQIAMKAGRFFSKSFATDSNAVVINEATLRDLGTTDVIGKQLTALSTYEGAKSYTIIGVVKDFHWESLHQGIRPLGIFLFSENRSGNVLNVRMQGSDVKGTIEFLKHTWEKFSAEPFYSNLVDRDLQRMYDAERKIADIAIVVSLLAIFIACLGLFGLASFVTEQRVKEIGIRKVMGASVPEIVVLLSKEFTKRVLFANAIAWPVAFYCMNTWLQNFAYRISINVWIFIAAGLLALMIALATVSFQAIKAAIANPIQSLRYE
ncbi:MAG TPA: ABC transporter permease [Bacteroidota bacterium]|nr:ABC transporter permease [Bacteroidota bacterium]